MWRDYGVVLKTAPVILCFFILYIQKWSRLTGSTGKANIFPHINSIMRTNVPEKLIKIADQIEETGSVALTKLTVLKKWFERPSRLSSFAIFVAKRACSRKGKTIGEAAVLFLEARTLLMEVDVYAPNIPRAEAENLHTRLKAFQNEYKNSSWGQVRLIHNRNLFLVEEGLRVYLWHTDSPSEGYRLAANYCEHYDPRYGNGLNGPSYTKINEIVRFMFSIEALEE